jgi:hypothetical protein
MGGSQRFNPFARRETHDKTAVLVYKILTFVSWLLLLISSVYYAVRAPGDGKYLRRSIWGQNAIHPTAFSLNSVITSIYWIVLFILQVGYVSHLFSSNVDYVNAAASVGSHFIFHNLLSFGFVMLFVRSHFWWAELLLIINFFNLSFLYFRHATYPRFIHIPVVSAPLAWTFVAVYWNGAIMVNAHTTVTRILGNVVVWSILVYGLFFLAAYKDYTMGFALSILTASLGVGQFFTKTVAFQWIFAFTIMATLFVATVFIAVPGVFGNAGREPVISEDQERAPLLDDS